MTKIRDKVVLVTGGANGIGKMLGEKCLKEGASDLIIWDINEKNLTETAQELKNKGYNVHQYLVDVSDLKDIKRAATLTLAEVGKVDILFNNAGIVVGKNFEEHSHEEIERTIRINVLGVMHVARAFVPDMIKQGNGHVINIASAAGLLPNPKMTVYVGSKWAVLGWSESLRIEMEEAGKDLHVTTVCPGYIKTGMFEGVEAPAFTPLLEPEDITNDIIKAVKNNDIELKAPWSVNLIPILRSVMPTRLFDLVVGRGLNIYSSMASFVGRNPKEVVTNKEQKTA
jgi:all-trans-retinol dehydrogenase (NAD+)